ncbi:hypothetical protein MMC29_003993 [Sticta canariensis]|nr:hypothetical protein [Sticta canariensis]
MDDLSGLDWTASNPNSTTQKLPPMNPPSYYPSLRPSPSLSGRSTPPSILNSSTGFKPPQIPSPNPNPNLNSISRSNNSTPVNDSFAKLVTFNAPQSTANGGSLKNLSLLEQQKALQEKKKKEEDSQNNHLNTGFGPQDGDFLESLGSGRVTPNRVVAPPSYAGTDEYGGQKLSSAINKPFASIGSRPRQQSGRIHDNGENDLLSAFESSSSVKISNSSHGLASNDNGVQARESNGGNHRKPAAASLLRSPSGTRDHTADLDDDPFGLGSMRVENTLQTKQVTATADDDDILGALGRPVSAFPPLKEREQSPPKIIHESMGPAEIAWARLIDMGFSPEKSREALERTESGLDVEAAVSYLLNQAHQDSSKKSRSQNETSASQRRQDNRSTVDGEKDPEKYAAEFGTNFLKTANSLWKTGTKKLNQAVSELNFDNESDQPRWMREAPVGADNRRSRRQERQSGDSSDDERQTKAPHRSSKSKQLDFTDEVLQLESGDGRPPRRHPRQQQTIATTTTSLDSSREKSPAFIKSREQDLRPQRFMQSPQIQDKKSIRKTVEEQTLNNYISPARRKKTTPKPPSPEPNLLFDAFEPGGSHSQTHEIPPVQSASRFLSQSPDPSRSLPATRNIPEISSMVLQTCTKNRLEGMSAFKMGDYPTATANYTTALSALPQTHPLNIVLYTNRALAHLKTGDPKSSIADSKSALSVIGPSRGAHETINLGGTEGSKDMKVFWTKAMTRQAEALEQLERWSDAAAVWKSCVEAGVGGATSIAGRNRCEKAAAGPSQTPRALKPTASKKSPPEPASKMSALEYLSADASGTPSLINSHSQSAEAVTRLRRANAAAERLDDEKFALADQVSERLAKWRAGKEGNLRALLASLENVLWEGAGWKKVGMSELILAGKVKVVYMRGIGKVHPDKLPPTASTEQKMISAAVFATLNEAWDGFKRENGL